MGVLRVNVGGTWQDVSVIGPPGPQGPPGPAGGGSASYVHNQATPAAVWTIPHNLGFFPNVTVVDSSGAQVEGDVVFSTNQVQVTFSAAFSGTAYLS
jgi:hypothetical protein